MAGTLADTTARGLRTHLEHGTAPPDEAVRVLAVAALESGFKNLMTVGVPGAKGGAERTVSLAHRMHTLAAVRNLVTHRASAGVATLAAFRRSYYAAFEDLVALA